MELIKVSKAVATIAVMANTYITNSLTPMETSPSSNLRANRFISSHSRYIGPAPWSGPTSRTRRIHQNPDTVPLNTVTPTVATFCLEEDQLPNIPNTPLSQQNKHLLLVEQIPFRKRWTIKTFLSIAAFLIPAGILVFLATKHHLAVLYWLSSGTCFICRFLCLVNRIFFSGSWDEKCKLALLAHPAATNPDATSLSFSFFVNMAHPLQNPGNLWPQWWARDPMSSITPHQHWVLSEMKNLATIEAGVSIIPRYTSPTHDLPVISWSERMKSSILGYSPKHLGTPSPYTIFEDPMRKNECWRTSGTSGHVGLKLNTSTPITHMSMDYFSPNQLTLNERQSAPTNMSLWALVTDNFRDSTWSEHYITLSPSRFISPRSNNLFPFFNDNFNPHQIDSANTFVKLADMAYNISEPSSRQFFPIRPLPPIQNPTQVFLLQIKGNEGANTTCLYSIGMYGGDHAGH